MTIPIEIQTILHLRPLSKKERDDKVCLEAADQHCAILRPPPSTLTPSQKLVQQTLSPETMVHDREYDYHFNQTIDSHENNKLWTSVGHPATLKAMAPLVEYTQDSSSGSSNSHQTQLIVGVGTVGSGKSYSLMREQRDSQGLVFQIIDSLFRQSQHINKGKFAINISARQVTQPKNSAKENECNLHDLFQNKQPKVSSKLQNLVGQFERTTSGSTASSTNYSSLEEPVFLEQEKNKADFHVVNGQTRMVKTEDEARDTILKALQQTRRNVNKNTLSHVLLQIQPLIVNKKNEEVCKGNIIGILKMASFEIQTKKRTKEMVGVRCDGHSSLIHCLRTLQENDKLIAQSKSSLKKVPFLQHKLTRLVQPLFSSKHSENIMVSVIMHAYPGHRDHSEKRLLLQDVESLKYKSEVPSVITPRVSREIKSASSKASTSGSKPKATGLSAPLYIKPVIKSPVPATISTPTLERASSMTYSESTVEDDENVIPLRPPPFAPSHGLPEARAVTYTPSAPVEYDGSPYASAVVIDEYNGVPMSPFVPTLPSVSKPRFHSTREAKSEASAYSAPSFAQIPFRQISSENSPTVDHRSILIQASKKLSKPVFHPVDDGEKRGNDREEDLLQRIEKLEAENRHLKHKVEELEKSKHSLQEENKSLKKNQRDSFGSPPQPRPAESPTAYAKTPPIDRSLFQYMAAMDKQRQELGGSAPAGSRNWASQSTAAASKYGNGIPRQFSLKIPQEFKPASQLQN